MPPNSCILLSLTFMACYGYSLKGNVWFSVQTVFHNKLNLKNYLKLIFLMFLDNFNMLILKINFKIKKILFTFISK